LAADPPLLLLDEPFGALDPLTRASLQREFAELAARLGKTAVLVTHDVREAMILGTASASCTKASCSYSKRPNAFAPQIIRRRALTSKHSTLTEVSSEFPAVSPGKLVRALAARATAHCARLRRDSHRRDHRRSGGNTFNSPAGVAWSSAGRCERDADDSESRVVWLSDSASIYRRHRYTHGPRRARSIFAVADHSQHGYGNTQRRSECSRSCGRDGNDRRPGVATGRAAARDGCDRYGNSRRDGDRGRCYDDRGGSGRGWTRSLHLPRFAAVRQ